MGKNALEKRKVVVDILGSQYNILTDVEEADVRKTAAFVDELIKDTRRSAPYMNTYTASILSCLNLCEELFKIKDEVTSLRESKEEYEILSEYKEKLVDALEEAEANEAKRMSMQIKFERLEIENEELKDLLEEYKEKFTTMRTEIETNRRTINDLQNKLLENQIDLVKARKNILSNANVRGES